MRDATLDKSYAVSVDAAVLTADTDGAGVDLQGFESATCLFGLGASGDTLSGTVYLAGVVQESDDNTVFTDVVDADLTTTEPLVDDPAEDSTVYAVGYVGHKRYIRMRFDLTGTHTNGTPCSGVVELENARHVGGVPV